MGPTLAMERDVFSPFSTHFLKSSVCPAPRGHTCLLLAGDSLWAGPQPGTFNPQNLFFVSSTELFNTSDFVALKDLRALYTETLRQFCPRQGGHVGRASSRTESQWHLKGFSVAAKAKLIRSPNSKSTPMWPFSSPGPPNSS